MRRVPLAWMLLACACGEPPPALSPVTLELQGELTESDPRAPHDAAPYDEHRFEAEAGWEIVVEMRSEAFDTYLWLTDPERPWPYEDDDGLEGTNSVIAVNARTRGTYRVLASSFDPAGRGPYTLRILAGPGVFTTE